MFTKGRVIACVIGSIYFSVFCVLAAFAHVDEHESHSSHSSSELCVLVNKTAARISSKNPVIDRVYQQLANTTNSVGHLETLGWSYISQSRDLSEQSLILRAGEVAECLLTKDEQNLAGKLLLGHVRHQQHRFSEAHGLATELVQRRGYWFDHALLGDLQVERGDLKGAVASYEAMVAQRPGSQSFVRIAQLRWLTGDLQGGISAAQLALSAVSGSREQLAWIQTKLAEFLLHDGQLQKALWYAERALDSKPDYPQSLAMQGRVLLSLGRAQEAIVVLRRSLQKSALPETQWLLLESLKETGNGDTVTSVEQALVSNHEDPRTISLYLATTKADPVKALRLAKAELKNRQDALSLDALAWAYHANGDYEAAQEFSQQAVTHGLRHGRIYLHAAIIGAARGDDAAVKKYSGLANESAQVLLPSEHKLLKQLTESIKS